MTDNFLKLEELTTSQLNSLNREKTIFCLTVSPIENHGEHLPLGMDILESEAILKGVANRFKESYIDWNIIICPVIPMACNLMPGTGSISIRQNIIRDYIIDFFSSLAKRGFKYGFVSGFHGGPKHLVAVDEAITYINRKHNMTVVAPFGYCFTNVQADKLKLPNKELYELFDQNRGDIHGGMLETSFMLHLRPDLVKEYKHLEEINIFTKNPLKKAKALKKALKYGYLGSPAKANKEIGKMLLDDAVEIIYEELCACIINNGKVNKSVDSSKMYLKTDFKKNLSLVTIITLITSLAGYLLFKNPKIYESLFKKS